MDNDRFEFEFKFKLFILQYHGTSTLCKQTQNADCGEDQYCTGDSNQVGINQR